MTKAEFSLALLKILCPYILILTCLFAKNVRNDIISMVVGASCALLTPASFTQKKDGTQVISTDKTVVTNDSVINEIAAPGVSSIETDSIDDSSWK